MFTGIVQTTGKVVDVDRREASASMAIAVDRDQGADALDLHQDPLKSGESIAVEGVCLTVTRADSHRFEVDAVPETLRRTTLGDRTAGDPVNLERSLRPGDRIGGHFVLGHVDAVGRIQQIEREENARVIQLAVPSSLTGYLVEKGSVAVDGVSLTVARTVDRSVDGHEQAEHQFEVSIIPHTWKATTLHNRSAGDGVNIEVDVIARYLEGLQRGEGATVFDA